MDEVAVALGIAIGLLIGLPAREIVKARVAVRLGDPSPVRFGRTGIGDPKSWLDPFGSIILPILAVIVALAGKPLLVLPFAYAKAMPLDPMMLRRARAGVWISVAGPLANLALAAIAGVSLRLPMGPSVWTLVYGIMISNLIMFVVHLLPIPGLDGAALLVRVLPSRPAEVFRNLDQYLVLFILGIFFVLGGPLGSLVTAIAGLFARLFTGTG